MRAYKISTGKGRRNPPRVPPVVTVAVSIVGTPTVGTASSYTPATVTGTVTSRTRRWQINNADVSTSATYTPITGDVGKTLRIIETITNSDGSVNSTSVGKVVQPIATPVDPLTNALTHNGDPLAYNTDPLVYTV
jgi:hypothetical protein